MKIWTHRYQLVPKQSLNSVASSQGKDGCLLRVEFDDGKVGFSDLFPWIELGDQTIEDQLWSLKTGSYTELAFQSLNLARLDAEFRSEGKSTFNAVANEEIQNHFLIPNIYNFDLVELVDIEEKGFKTIKVKMGRELLRETVKLEELADCFSENFKLRLDFNCQVSFDEIESWLGSLSETLKKSIEFVEDPMPYNGEFWQALSEVFGVPFALDMAADPLSTGARGADIVVLKPAKQNVFKVVELLKNNGKKFVLTHYMDHPVGQRGAISLAQRLKQELGDQLLDCGLLDFSFYEPNDFNLSSQNISPVAEQKNWSAGIGFNEKLEGLDWKIWK